MSDYMTMNQALQMKADLRKITGITNAKGNTVLSSEQHKKILEDVVIAARQQMIARTLLGTDIEFYNEFGIQTISYDTLTEMSVAQLDYKLTENEDTVGLTRSNAPVPILHKEFEIDARDLASSQLQGTPLSTSAPQSAAYRVAQLENTMVLKGFTRDGSTYEINGMYEGAGNNYSTSKDFGTAGNPLAAVGGAIALAMADNIMPPYNMVLNPTQFNELSVSVLGSGAGMSEMAAVRNLLQSGAVDQGGNGGGLILASTDITTGTGLVVAAPGRGFYKYHVPLDLTTKMTVLEKSENLWGRTMIAGLFVYNDANSGIKMTTI